MRDLNRSGGKENGCRYYQASAIRHQVPQYASKIHPQLNPPKLHSSPFQKPIRLRNLHARPLHNIPHLLQHLRIHSRAAHKRPRPTRMRNRQLDHPTRRFQWTRRVPRPVIDDGTFRTGTTERFMVLPVSLLALFTAVGGFFVKVAFS